MSFPLFEEQVGTESDWVKKLCSEFGHNEGFYKRLSKNIEEMYNDNGYAKSDSVYPRNKNDIFRAFQLTSFKKTRVVIMGEAPYPSSAAHGLSFSVKPKTNIYPPTLCNIFMELRLDTGCDKPSTTCLKKWAERGVLLLNTRLTCGIKGLNWKRFIDAVIKVINDKGSVVFMLWGTKAVEKKSLITNTSNKVICSSHPSPMSAYEGFITEDGEEVAKFFESRPFSQASNFLGCSNEELWRL